MTGRPGSSDSKHGLPARLLGLGKSLTIVCKTPVTSTLRKLRQEDVHKFEASLVVHGKFHPSRAI